MSESERYPTWQQHARAAYYALTERQREWVRHKARWEHMTGPGYEVSRTGWSEAPVAARIASMLREAKV